MESPFKSHPRIFIVDDEPGIAQLLTVVMQMNLYDAVSFTDPQAALEAATVRPPEYLLSDIVMPGMSGIELAIALQRVVPACKILLFSGHTGAEELIEKARISGHDFALVQKPIHPTKLIEAIREL